MDLQQFLLRNGLTFEGIHPTVISESFQRAAGAAVRVLHDMSQPISLSDRPTLLQAATTSLSSKIVSQHSNLLAPMAVDAVLKTIDQKVADNVDLKNIRIIKKVGGTIEDSEMVDGLVLNQMVVKSGGGPARMEKARIGLIQFQLSPPKPDVRSSCTISVAVLTNVDGEPNSSQRLPTNGQDLERRTNLPSESGQKDQES